MKRGKIQPTSRRNILSASSGSKSKPTKSPARSKQEAEEFHQTAWHYIPEDKTLLSCRYENLKSKNVT
jgi:hypothetical protein